MNLYLAPMALAISTFSFASALVISENTIGTIAFDRTAEDITVNSGVYYWLVNNYLTNFGGAFNNNGGFFITSVNGLASDVLLTGDSFKNSGTFDLNTLGSQIVSVYNISTTGTFENSGDMYLGVSGGFIVNTPFTVTSGNYWTNTGRMVIEKDSGPAAPVIIGQNVGKNDVHYIANNGAICLYNVVWDQTTNIIGKGCIGVGGGSKLRLRISVDNFSYHISSSQIINLEAPDAQLDLIGLTRDFLASFPTIKVAGFGKGNSIKIDHVFKGYIYNPKTGILKLKFIGPFGLNFDIGKGYDSSKFSKSGGLEGSSVSYNGTPPKSPPAICSCEKVIPEVDALMASTSEHNVVQK
ncbi:hypothetical protein JCM33374_g2499 [Metschnikowia sp. JCM 33374]|nr:hypothetical protein JCM33374_g2499 [Metschnikowia sp. JCM 33374]